MKLFFVLFCFLITTLTSFAGCPGFPTMSVISPSATLADQATHLFITRGDSLLFKANSNMSQGCEPLGLFIIRHNGSEIYRFSGDQGSCHAVTLFGDTGNYSFTAVGSAGKSVEFTVAYDQTSSLGENMDLSLRIYPVPASEVLQVEMDFSPLSFSVMNSTGQQLLSLAPSDGNIKLDLQAFPPGIYFLSIIKEDGHLIVRKFLVAD